MDGNAADTSLGAGGKHFRVLGFFYEVKPFMDSGISNGISLKQLRQPSILVVLNAEQHIVILQLFG